MSETEPLLEIRPSGVRRWVALLSQGFLALLLLGLALGEMPDLWRLFFALLGVLVLWSAKRMHDATSVGLLLTRAGLQTTEGQMLAAVDNIKRVERGVFAFKPSNGFLVRLIEPGTRGWAPGLWWRVGRRLGVGGTLSGGQTRAMADLMTALVMERDGEV